jgi:hypothetical protein
MFRSRSTAPVYLLLSVVAILTVVRWAGLGDAQTLAVVNLTLLSVMVVWGSLITRRQRRR